MMFDGMLVYSTCRTCGELMQVLDVREPWHPCCDNCPTDVESLAVGWLWCAQNNDGRGEKLLEKEIEAIDLAPPDLSSAAVEYAEQGWPVFPLARHTKIPAIKGGKGFKDATDNPDRIRRWWKRHPDCNIGLATGHLFDVVDIDTKDSDGNPSTEGVVSLCNALQQNQIPETHGLAVTASGGMHLYVKPTGKGCFAAIRPGIDYRGKGGYVVAPPSWLGTRERRYTWMTVPSPIIKGGF